jgi:hypothetical protein
MKSLPRSEALENHRLQDAGGDAEIEGVPAVCLTHGGAETDADGVIAAAVKGEDEMVLFGADVFAGSGGGFGEGDGAVEEVEGAAADVRDAGGGGEGEIGEVVGEVGG